MYSSLWKVFVCRLFVQHSSVCLDVRMAELTSLLKCRWLDSACDAAAVRAAHPDLPSQEVDGVVEIAKEVRQSLAEDTAARTEFWKLLLRECGLQAHLNQTS